jgi:hypothetical protein
MIRSAAQSSIVNDTKYTSMSAGIVPSSEYLIETAIVGVGGATDIVFSNLSQHIGIYRHLKICGTARTSNGGALDFIAYRFNGDAGTNYTRHALFGTGSSAGSYGLANTTFGSDIDGPASTAPAGAYSATEIDILDAFSTNKFKTVRAFNGSAGVQVGLASSLWRNTAAINQIRIFSGNSANLVQGTRFSLYGVTA